MVGVRKVPSSPISLPDLSVLEQNLANTSKASQRQAIDSTDSDKDGTEPVVFLGNEVTQTEYQEICRNLGEFFKLLRKWAEEACRNEETDTQE